MGAPAPPFPREGAPTLADDRGGGPPTMAVGAAGGHQGTCLQTTPDTQFYLNCAIFLILCIVKESLG